MKKKHSRGEFMETQEKQLTKAHGNDILKKSLHD